LPVTFINAMNVKASDDTLFVETWDEGARYVATQPGFIATSLHKSQSTAAKFQYHRGWESRAHFVAATSTEWWKDYRARFGFGGEASRSAATPAICDILHDAQGLFP
jgi:heme-degrading monooxygenase HmoA